MSRCFPFPPPGYEAKPRSEHRDLLKKRVHVALGLLLSELCDEPWHHRVITFSERPQLHHVNGKTLSEKASFIREMHWCMNTDFQAVFDQLLYVVVAGNLPPERMVRKVFVFSDMEFDEASSRARVGAM